jgi:plastocyanin
MSRVAGRVGRRLFVAVAVLTVALALPLSSDARRHRLHLPIPPLPTSLSVDEQEWSITPSHTVVAAGTVTFHDYNRGMDTHNLTIKGPNGQQDGATWVQSGGSGTIVAKLQPGTYLLYCSMFMGTPQSHYAKGMHTLITVR